MDTTHALKRPASPSIASIASWYWQGHYLPFSTIFGIPLRTRGQFHFALHTITKSELPLEAQAGLSNVCFRDMG